MPSTDQLSRLAAVVPFAQATERRWGVPASITLAQWIFESGWGADRIAIECNNCFGIKHLQANRAEAYRAYRTPEFAAGESSPHIETANFVRYSNIGASFEAHGRLLATAALYGPAMQHCDDPHAFARALQICGYAGRANPRYAKQISDAIDEYHLTQFDTPEPPAKATA